MRNPSFSGNCHFVRSVPPPHLPPVSLWVFKKWQLSRNDDLPINSPTGCTIQLIQGILLLTVHSSVRPHLLFSQCREIPVSITQKAKHWILTIRGQLPHPRRIHPKTLRQSRKPFLQPNLNRLRLLQHPVRPPASYQSILRP